MQVEITNPLRGFLGWRPFGPWDEEADPLFCWDAHRVVIDGRVMLVVCNASNRLAGVTAMHGGDWKRMRDVCADQVEQAMLCAGFPAEAVRAYLERAGEVEFGRTHGRKAVAHLNRMVETLKWCECDHGEQLQPFLMHVVNDEDLCHCATREGYGVPAVWMAEDLRAHGIDPRVPRRSHIDYAAEAAPAAPAPADCQGAEKRGAPDGGSWESIEVFAQSGHIFPAEDEKRLREIDARIADAERAMLAGRGLAVPHASGCRVCGAPPRVRLDSDDYCLGCYNELIERVMGIPPVTNDRSTLAAFKGDGGLVQFGVERLVTPLAAEWVAREIVADGDPRAEEGYEGVTVSTYADPAADQDEALSELWEKAQQAVEHPSTHAEGTFNGMRISNGATRRQRGALRRGVRVGSHRRD